jgi:CheY-like chemotaxis protein
MKRKEPKYKYAYVMLVDDDDLDNFINEKILEGNLFAEKIYKNTSARAALEFLTNLSTLGDQFTHIFPEVIFIDINMPMMDGFQFIENFKKNFTAMTHTKLVILTSSVYHEDRSKAEAISEDIIFLNKPLTKDLLEKI